MLQANHALRSTSRHLLRAPGSLVAILLALSMLTSCDSNEPLPPVASAPVSEVSVQDLVAAPEKFNGARVRVIAPCHIEFEGSALYATPAAQQARSAHDAVWLELKWPLLADRRALNGEYVLVEGRFTSDLAGRNDGFMGAIADVTRLEASSLEAGGELMRRVEQSR